MPKRKLPNGFTLVELLVVITVIGILAAVGVASYSGSQAKGRDARRKEDLKQIQNALQQYYSDKGYYPQTGWVFSTTYNPNGGPWIPGLDTNYMKQLPTDPLGTGYNYTYYADTSTQKLCRTINDTPGANYILFAYLENKNDPDVATHKEVTFGSSGTPCQWPGSGSEFAGSYILTNP